MRIAATCERCGREFLLFQLYTASPFAADRCPHCSAHLGIVRVAPLAASADEALAALVRSLREIAAPRARVTGRFPLAHAAAAYGAADEGRRGKVTLVID